MKNLDDVSPSMCLAKWVEGSLYISTGMTHSCHLVKRERASVDLVSEDPASIFNTPHKKAERKLMMEGKKHPGCISCIKIENANGISDRMYKNDMHFNYKESVVGAGYETNFAPIELEIGFDNTCNLKCMYCKPSNSSSWVSETLQYGIYPGGQGILEEYTSDEDKEKYTKAFWEWFPTIYSGLKELRITGGEPFLSKQTIKMLNYIIANPNPNLSFSINSNLSISSEIIKPYLEKINEMLEKKIIKDFKMYTSIESHGKRAEYIRYGLNYDLWKINLISILENYKNIEVIIMATYNVLSVTSFDCLLDYVEELKKKYGKYKITIDPVQMKGPDCLSINILRDRPNLLKFIKKSSDKINDSDFFVKLEKLRMQRIYQVSKSLPDIGIAEKRKTFIEFINEYDRRKKIDFLSVFPEMESFYYDCFKTK